MCDQDGKATTVRRTPVLDIYVSRYHYRDLVEGSAETPQTLQHYGIEGFKWGPQLGPHYAESAILTDSRRKCIQCGCMIIITHHWM